MRPHTNIYFFSSLNPHVLTIAQDDTRDINLDPLAPVSQELPHGGQLTERTLSNGTRVHIIRPRPKPKREFSTKTETFAMSMTKSLDYN